MAQGSHGQREARCSYAVLGGKHHRQASEEATTSAAQSEPTSPRPLGERARLRSAAG